MTVKSAEEYEPLSGSSILVFGNMQGKTNHHPRFPGIYTDIAI